MMVFGVAFQDSTAKGGWAINMLQYNTIRGEMQEAAESYGTPSSPTSRSRHTADVNDSNPLSPLFYSPALSPDTIHLLW
ncbi:hypothetical protein RRF57_004061 [Xylaria bambusicola]|uniref:Uncharacterized protein n=1 Tax=Xylaria bambusicola TaxID=326684 RepID=A0AAN7UN33_9PEZI